MRRYVVLFAREPGRQAREKGLDAARGTDLFVAFALGWQDAAASAGAALVIASPDDPGAWRRWIRESEALWMPQRGRTFGERLERCARSAARLPGLAVIVGGDVAPDRRSLRAAFHALENGAEAVLAPAEDGGISLVSLPLADCDLLSRIRIGSRSVFEDLSRELSARSRSAVVLDSWPDVDGRRDVRRILHRRIDVPRSVLRSALGRHVGMAESSGRVPRALLLSGPPGLRAPPGAV